MSEAPHPPLFINPIRLGKHRMKHTFPSVENRKGRDISIAEILINLWRTDYKGDGVMLTDKPGRRETQVRKAAGRWRLLPEQLWDRRQQT